MHLNYNARNFFTLITASVFMSACTTLSLQTDTTDRIEPMLDSLVTAAWLSEHLDDPDLVVLDCTVLIVPDDNGGIQSLSGRANFDAGHIPSAGFADLMGDLSDLDNPFEFAMPSPEQFSAAMGALGVGEDSRVVLYAAGYPVWAGPGLVDAALGWIRSGGAARWRARGMESRRSGAVAGIGQPTCETVYCRSPTGNDRGPRSGVCCHQRQHCQSHRRNARRPLPGSVCHVCPTRPHSQCHEHALFRSP